MSNSVYLSPSTQEKNIGAGGYKSEELRMNQVCDITEKILKKHGIVVYRNKPNMNISQVVANSNSKKPKIHFAIHSNAFNKKARGCEIFCHRKGGEGEKLAKAVYKYIEALTPTDDRGIKEGFNFYGKGKHMYEVAYTTAPAALIEIAFHDNLLDANWIILNINNIGVGIARGILDFFEIKYIKEDETMEDFPITDKAINILKEISKYSNAWIAFFKENQHINLSGLIENLYEKCNEAENNYKEIIKDRQKLANQLETIISEISKETSSLTKIKNNLK